MSLSGSQYEQFTIALLDAFPGLEKLRMMVRFRLEKNLDAIAMGDDLKAIVFRLIGAAEAEGWTFQLMAAARESNPGNPKLLAFSQLFGLASVDISRSRLERTIKATNSFLDVEHWRTKLGELEGRVCRVEIPLSGGKYQTVGTGFLLGPDVAITNYHVMESVIKTEQGTLENGDLKAAANDVILRFDYKRLSDGKTLNTGTEYHLAAQDWLIDSSPMSPLDDLPAPQPGVPQKDQLDYALLRIEGEPGNNPIGKNPEPGAPKRGWIEIPEQGFDFPPNTPLLILQHPEGKSLKLVFDTEAIMSLNENKTRVTYSTNTETGSSGSPCFNINWELVALHHAGDPNFDSDYKPEYNQGIPFTTILDLLRERGLEDLFGEQEL